MIAPDTDGPDVTGQGARPVRRVVLGLLCTDDHGVHVHRRGDKATDQAQVRLVDVEPALDLRHDTGDVGLGGQSVGQPP